MYGEQIVEDSRRSNSKTTRDYFRLPSPCWYDHARFRSRLRVPFGKGELIGICVETKSVSDAGQLREIAEVVDSESMVSADLLDLALWMAKYYHHLSERHSLPQFRQTSEKENL